MVWFWLPNSQTGRTTKIIRQTRTLQSAMAIQSRDFRCTKVDKRRKRLACFFIIPEARTSSYRNHTSSWDKSPITSQRRELLSIFKLHDFDIPETSLFHLWSSTEGTSVWCYSSAQQAWLYVIWRLLLKIEFTINWADILSLVYLE